MRSRRRHAAVVAVAVMAFVHLAAIGGCGPAGPKTYPVRGKVESTAGGASQLAGNHIEAVLEQDPTVRASGVIQADGSFTLQTLHAGIILKGAREGTYQARILLDDDGDRQARRLRRAAVHPRFLKF